MSYYTNMKNIYIGLSRTSGFAMTVKQMSNARWIIREKKGEFEVKEFFNKGEARSLENECSIQKATIYWTRVKQIQENIIQIVRHGVSS